MNLDDLRTRLKTALHNDADEIQAHIASVTSRGRTKGIEGAFANALHKTFADLGFQRERPLSSIGLDQFYEGRRLGRSDCYIEETKTAFEYKAVAMPRSESSARFDVGQILADFARFANQDVLERA